MKGACPPGPRGPTAFNIGALRVMCFYLVSTRVGAPGPLMFRGSPPRARRAHHGAPGSRTELSRQVEVFLEAHLEGGGRAVPRFLRWLSRHQ